MKKVSVIIPCYNVEDYIDECIKSIINQTYKSIEIIAINDGSTDSTLEKLNKYKNKIKIINQNNKGVGYSRNIGIKKSTGDYILFIDSDDFLNTENDISNMIKEIDDSDILFYRFNYYYNKDRIKESKLINIEGNNVQEIFHNMIKNDSFNINSWSKLIRKKIIEENNILFEENIYSEDFDFSLNLYKYIDKISVSNNIYYNYRQNRNGSLTKEINKKNIKSSIYVMDKWIKQDYNNEEIKNNYFNFIACEYVYLLQLITKNNINDNDIKWLKEHIYLLNYSLNFKVKLAKKIYKIFGYNILTVLLKQYNVLKRKGLLKL